MGVRDFLNTEEMNHFVVLASFLFLESLNCKLSMVDCQEVDEFSVVINVFIGNFNGCLQTNDVIFFT